MALDRSRMSRDAWVRRIGRRAARGLQRMKRERAGGIRLVLVDEHNARDEQKRFEEIALWVAHRFRKEGYHTDVHAYETEQMGGQHMEWINHVVLTIRKKAPSGEPVWAQSDKERAIRILDC
jgi:hypothetical protein